MGNSPGAVRVLEGGRVRLLCVLLPAGLVCVLLGSTASPGSLSSYLSGLVMLAVLGTAAAVLARNVSGRIVPEWTGALAALAQITVALAFVVVVSEVLGSFGELRRWPLVAVAVAIAVGVGPGRRTVSAPAPSPSPRGRAERVDRAVAAGVVTLALAPWVLKIAAAAHRGIVDFDSLYYHLPAAADFAQSGFVTHALFFANSDHAFFPWNSELLHAVGMVAFHDDRLSLILNLGWAAAALLAGWCIGKPFGAPVTSLAAAAVVLGLPIMVNSQPGAATSDTAGLALLLAAVAFVVNGATSPPAVAVPALAAGLAAGTRINLLLPVLALAAWAIALEPSRTRRGSAALWAGGLCVTGAYWFARNVVVAHNPLPWFRLGVGGFALPASSGAPADCGRTTVAHDLAGSAGLRMIDRVLPASFGTGWGLLFALCALGVVGALAFGRDRRLALLAGLALVNAVGYAVTPGTGAAGEGCLPYTTRFLTPTLALALVALAACVSGARRSIRLASLAALALTALLTVPAAVVWLPGAAVIVLLVLRVHPARPRAAAARWVVVTAGALCAVALLAVGWEAGRHYLRDRYASGSALKEDLTPSYRLLRAAPPSRVAVWGFVESYLLYGPTLDDRVAYPVLRGPHGSFAPIVSRAAWQAWLVRNRIDYVVLSRSDVEGANWTASLPGARRVLDGSNIVYELARHGVRS